MFSPVVIIVFNRPEFTAHVLEKILAANIRNVYVVIDGPRKTSYKDVELRSKVIKLVKQAFLGSHIKVNWIVSDVNLGLEKRITSALDRVFMVEKRAIILEDDCVPDISFFKFCEEMLDYYEGFENITHISGTCFVPDLNNDESYFFSKYPIEWGWATWANAWKNYNKKMTGWESYRNSSDFRGLFQKKRYYNFWKWILDRCFLGEQNSWAYKWVFTNLKMKTLSVTPRENLISNIGLGNNSTNTLLQNEFAQPKVKPMIFPLVHPRLICINQEYDSILDLNLHSKSLIWLEIISKRLKPIYKNIISRFIN